MVQSPDIMTVSLSLYRRLMDNRPLKFNEDEVNFRKSDGDERCEGCVHYFTRGVDGYSVCEIYRSDTEERSIPPDYVCDFHTTDGEKFPLLDGDGDEG